MKINTYKPEGIKRPRLSILIPSITERSEQLEKLVGNLKGQIDDRLSVEIITGVDNRDMSIGEKRNKLVEAASGTYTVFIDDDDEVSPVYVQEILDAIITYKPDVIGFYVNCLNYPSKGKSKLALLSLQCTEWKELPDIINRTPNHLAPVKRSIAQKVKYPHIRYGEDYAYSVELYKHLKDEHFIDKVMYIYDVPQNIQGRYEK
jgi:glycosyltransferase involved in cell wall biosynthesis